MERFFRLLDPEIIRPHEELFNALFSMSTFKRELVITINIQRLVEYVPEYEDITYSELALDSEKLLFLTGYSVKDLDNFDFRALILEKAIDQLVPLYCVDSCDVLWIGDGTNFSRIRRLSSFKRDATLQTVLSTLRRTYLGGRFDLAKLFLTSDKTESFVSSNEFFSSVRNFLLTRGKISDKQARHVHAHITPMIADSLLYNYIETYRKDYRPCEPGEDKAEVSKPIEVLDVKKQKLIPTKAFKYYRYPFDYFNPVQSKAFDYLDSNCNLVVAAATSSGKTILAELFMWKVLQSGKRVLYVSPMKALTNEKYEDWQEKFNVPIVLATSDFGDSDKDLTTALMKSKIICMTSEMLDSKSRKYHMHKKWIQDIGLVIVDEAHIIGTESRGLATEVGLIRFLSYNPDPRVLFLSATAPNVRDFCRWLTALTGRNTEYIYSDWRPVETEYEIISQKNNSESLIQILESYPDDKFLIFVATKPEGRSIVKRIKQHLKDKGVEKPEKYVTFHNADLSLLDRSNIEKSFKAGDLQYLVSTSTLAWGVNLPARHVLIASTMRGYDEISTADIIQMAGRAGRFGLDDRGYVHIFKSPTDTREDQELITPPAVKSQLALFVSEGEYQYKIGRTLRIVQELAPQLKQQFIKMMNSIDSHDRVRLNNYQTLLCRILSGVKPSDVEYVSTAYSLDNYSRYRATVLAEIARGQAHTVGDLMHFLSRSLMHFQGYKPDLLILTYFLLNLAMDGFIRVRGNQFVATEIGRITTDYYLLPEDTLQLIVNLKHLSQIYDSSQLRSIPEEYIAWLYALIPSKCTGCVSALYTDKRLKKQHTTSAIVFTLDKYNNRRNIFYNPRYITELYESRGLFDEVVQVNKRRVARSSPNFQIIYHHLKGNDIKDLRSDLKARGYALLADLQRFSLALVKLNDKFHFTDRSNIVAIIRRVEYGVPAEFVPLVSVKNIGRARAKVLYENGIKTAEDILKNKEKVAELLGQRVAGEIVKSILELDEEV